MNPGFMLTALVKLTGENSPRKGFFKLAAEKDFFDPSTDDEMDFRQKQVSLAHDAYKRVRPARA